MRKILSNVVVQSMPTLDISVKIPPILPSHSSSDDSINLWTPNFHRTWRKLFVTFNVTKWSWRGKKAPLHLKEPDNHHTDLSWATFSHNRDIYLAQLYPTNQTMLLFLSFFRTVNTAEWLSIRWYSKIWFSEFRHRSTFNDKLTF